jgi:hypothetical protein
MSKHFRIFLSILLSSVVLGVWAKIIIWDANRAGGDNGWDPFGGVHIIFLLASAPFVIYFSSKYIYKKLLKKEE